MRERYAAPRQNDPGLRLPHPLRRSTAPWPSARAARSWPGSFCTRPMTSPIPRSSPSTSPARPGPAWAPRMWPWPSSAPPSRTALVKNAVMEFFGPGVANLSMDYRGGIDVMTTETTCLSSVWQTDEQTEGLPDRSGPWREQLPGASPGEGAYYDGADRGGPGYRSEPMIALPFHPSNAYTIREFKDNMDDLLHQVDAGRCASSWASTPARLPAPTRSWTADSGWIRGSSPAAPAAPIRTCVRAAEILTGTSIGSGRLLAVLSIPASHAHLSGADPAGLYRRPDGRRAPPSAPASAVPASAPGTCPPTARFSIRHSTRNFPNREGSKPGDGQVSYVALMDARSIAATALNGGVLTAADRAARHPRRPGRRALCL